MAEAGAAPRLPPRRCGGRALGLWLLLAATVAGCAPGLDAAMAQAGDAMLQARYVEAEAQYLRLLQRLERYPQRQDQQFVVRQRLALLHDLYLRDPPRAAADYSALAQRALGRPAGRRALCALAELQAERLRDLPAAIDTYRRVVAEYSDHAAAPQALLAVVRAQLRQRAYPQVRQAAAELGRRYPDSAAAAQAAFDAAASLALQGRPLPALEAFERLSQQPLPAPLQALVRVEQAGCLQQLGQPRRALEALFEALPAHPQPRLVQAQIGRLRAALQRHAAGRRILQAARLPAAGRRTKNGV